ncbi:glycosyltransferase family 2 protein [Lactobacillus helveticus]|uniref:glycosyltransferase family 2 protein n=1 Tax=Lactobacillus helveticus TaxID=1587 RepID=UPI00197B624E|nr:glycosyltransferase family 2 protein [Lactobacillus helveticus]MBN6049691.1 glycosyltransferase family 2 protein [Lactobacillus helveticus]
MKSKKFSLIKKGMAKVRTFSWFISVGNICPNVRFRKIVSLILSPVGMLLLLSRKKKYKSPRYKLSIVLIIKNEADYIIEWIEYYKLLGFDRMYIYDNDSTDDVYQKILKYIKSALVDYTKISGRARQLDAYNDALKKAKIESKYLAIIDADEFIFSPQNINVYSIVEKYMTYRDKVGGVGINWLIFGSGGQKNEEKGLVTQRFYFRSRYNFNVNRHVKTICNPRKVAGILNPHTVEYNLGSYGIDCSYNTLNTPFTAYNPNTPLRINHYFTKSKSEFIKKRNRGEADSLNKRSMEEFDLHDRNEVFDDSMKRYKKILEKKVRSEE